jgi:adenosylmethionine-8-amino-7-oxononanoate aminotransferase
MFDRFLLVAVSPCSSSLADVYRQHIQAAIAAHEASDSSSSSSSSRRQRRLGALLLEPVLQGAGGMLLPDPLFQAELVKVGAVGGGEGGMPQWHCLAFSVV